MCWVVYLRPAWERADQLDKFNKNLPLEYLYLKDKVTVEDIGRGVKWIHLNDNQEPTVDCGFQVRAGSYDEVRPRLQTYDGTAHLLEHSVFLDQTPQERQMYTYWNAFTDDQQTQYHFATTPANALQAFKVSFRSLFNFKENPKSHDEINAVQSE